jgi:hypothetical protein
VDDCYEATWVENAALVTTRFPAYNFDDLGFLKCTDFFNWIFEGPIALELNRDCVAGEEIIVGYEWSSITEKMQLAEKKRLKLIEKKNYKKILRKMLQLCKSLKLPVRKHH